VSVSLSVTSTDIVNPESSETLYEAGTLLDEDMVELIESLVLTKYEYVRADLRNTLRSVRQVLWRDLGRGGMITVGESVGVIAAQSIGEPVPS